MYKFPVLKIMASEQVLGCNDVICGRHKDACANIGNRRFRILVAMLTPKYIQAPTRAHKSMVIREVVETIHGCGGRFVHHRKMKQCTNGITMIWEELSEKQIYDKVGHAFRDMSVSIQEKSDIKNILFPKQATASVSSLDALDDQLVHKKHENTSIPTLSTGAQQDATEYKENDLTNGFNHCNSNMIESDEDCWSFNISDDELEQYIVASEAMTLLPIFDINNIHDNVMLNKSIITN
jgi:hypothetical protein